MVLPNLFYMPKIMVKKPKNKKGIGPIKKGHILKDMTFFSLVGAEGFEPPTPSV